MRHMESCVMSMGVVPEQDGVSKRLLGQRSSAYHRYHRATAAEGGRGLGRGGVAVLSLRKAA